ncbi:MAG: hypothetical protein ACREDR_15450, partial [Blastocatellia bacterium]
LRELGRGSETVSEHYIEIQGVSIAFDEQVVLRDASFHMARGETAVILGRSGLFGVGDAASAFWKGFKRGFEPLRLVADVLVLPTALSQGVPLKYVEFSSGLGRDFHNRLIHGKSAIGAGLGAGWDFGKALVVNSILPPPFSLLYRHLRLELDYRSGKVTQDQYLEAYGELAGEAGFDAVVAGAGLIGGAIAGAGAGVGAEAGAEAGAAAEIVEGETAAQSSTRALTTTGEAAEGESLSSAGQGRLLPPGKEPLLLSEGNPRPPRFIADESGNMQDLGGRGNPNTAPDHGPFSGDEWGNVEDTATGRGNPNPIPRQGPLGLGIPKEGALVRLQATFDELAETRLLPQFREIDPNLRAGYTGSFKTGIVGNTNKPTFGQPIDLGRFDIDYWIESDALFKIYGPNLRANPAFRGLLSETPGFEGLKPNKGGFSIKFKPSSR